MDKLNNELIAAIEQILKDMDENKQRRLFKALMRYQNIDGLDLKEVLEQELDLENTKESPWNQTRPIRTAQGLNKEIKNVNYHFLYLD